MRSRTIEDYVLTRTSPYSYDDMMHACKKVLTPQFVKSQLQRPGAYLLFKKNHHRDGFAVIGKLRSSTMEVLVLCSSKKGFGSELLSLCVSIAYSYGFQKVKLHAVEEELGFYEKMGFTARAHPCKRNPNAPQRELDDVGKFMYFCVKDINKKGGRLQNKLRLKRIVEGAKGISTMGSQAEDSDGDDVYYSVDEGSPGDKGYTIPGRKITRTVGPSALNTVRLIVENKKVQPPKPKAKKAVAVKPKPQAKPKPKAKAKPKTKVKGKHPGLVALKEKHKKDKFDLNEERKKLKKELYDHKQDINISRTNLNRQIKEKTKERSELNMKTKDVNLRIKTLKIRLKALSKRDKEGRAVIAKKRKELVKKTKDMHARHKKEIADLKK